MTFMIAASSSTKRTRGFGSEFELISGNALHSPRHDKEAAEAVEPAFGVKAYGAALLSRLRLAHRQLPIRANEVAGIAVGIALQVILVLRFRLPERADRGHLGHHL